MSKYSRTSIATFLHKNPPCDLMINPLDKLPLIRLSITILLDCILITHNLLDQPQYDPSECSKSGRYRVIVCGSYVNNNSNHSGNSNDSHQ